MRKFGRFNHELYVRSRTDDAGVGGICGTSRSDGNEEDSAEIGPGFEFAAGRVNCRVVP
jgi:hypothetical protein